MRCRFSISRVASVSRPVVPSSCIQCCATTRLDGAGCEAVRAPVHRLPLQAARAFRSASTTRALDLGSLSSQHGHRLDHTTKMDSSLSSLDYLSSKHLTGPPSGASGAGHKGAPGNGEECPRGFQPYRGSAEELRHPTLGTLHPMSPFDAGAYPYHPTPFLAPHLAHPGYRLEDPLYQYNLLRPGPPMVSAPAMPPFFRYPVQQQAPPQQPPAQQQQRQQLTPPSLPVGPPRTDEFKEEQSRLLLLSSAKRTSDSPSPSLS
ncbi:hypothetical protein HPB51_023621 [Rhipicephalus microplus]|uniref:Uncharacterized protein n=1 Tax=Rhipicephalus microplus TaxID=6941 RepID=A0A9J6DCS4_RHIMP|nr:hypothetical protein HPB51_023621 [Rhipicephalus microplus]